MSRLEGLSDAAFAFSMSFLLVDTFTNIESAQLLYACLRELPVLAACFAMLLWIWYLHYQFFRRYGLEDSYTVFLNTVLMFTILVYVYLLKFIFTYVLRHLIYGEPLPPEDRGSFDGNQILWIYGAGFILIFVLLALMVHDAYRKREQLQLDEVEVVITRSNRGLFLWIAAVGLVSIGITLTAPLFPDHEGLVPGIAGMSYALIGPVSFWRGLRQGRQVEAALAKQSSS